MDDNTSSPLASCLMMFMTPDVTHTFLMMNLTPSLVTLGKPGYINAALEQRQFPFAEVKSEPQPGRFSDTPRPPYFTSHQTSSPSPQHNNHPWTSQPSIQPFRSPSGRPQHASYVGNGNLANINGQAQRHPSLPQMPNAHHQMQPFRPSVRLPNPKAPPKPSNNERRNVNLGNPNTPPK